MSCGTVKVNANQERVCTAGTVSAGDTFVYGGGLYIRVGLGVHSLDRGYAWAVRLADGLLSKFGTHTEVERVAGEFTSR